MEMRETYWRQMSAATRFHRAVHVVSLESWDAVSLDTLDNKNIPFGDLLWYQFLELLLLRLPHHIQIKPNFSSFGWIISSYNQERARTHTQTQTPVHKCSHVHSDSQGTAGAWYVYLNHNCNYAPPCQCFCLALNARRPHRQSALLPSSRRLKLAVENRGGGWLWKNWWKMVVVVGIKTHSTWSYIKNLCLSAGVSQVRLEVGWRSTLPHAYFIDNGEEKEGKKKRWKHSLKWLAPLNQANGFSH